MILWVVSCGQQGIWKQHEPTHPAADHQGTRTFWLAAASGDNLQNGHEDW